MKNIATENKNGGIEKYTIVPYELAKLGDVEEGIQITLTLHEFEKLVDMSKNINRNEESELFFNIIDKINTYKDGL